MANITAMGKIAAEVKTVVVSFTSSAGNMTPVNVEFDWNIYWMEMRTNRVYQVGEFLKNYTGLILSTIGIPCNILTFLIMKRLKPFTSTTFIMMILAVTDASNLLFSVIDRKIFFTYSDAACQAFWTASTLLIYMSVWLVVLLTFERIIAVCFPLKTSRICTVSNAVKAVICLLLADMVICSVHTFAYEMVQHNNEISCPIKAKYVELMDAWGVADGVFFAVIPLILLSLGNVIIIGKLRTSRDVDTISETSSRMDETKRQNRSVTLMLLAVSITTIACVGPNALIGLGGGFAWYFSVSGDVNGDAMKHFTYYIVLFISYINNSVNFFLYVLTGSRFRAEIRQMLYSLLGTLQIRRK